MHIVIWLLYLVIPVSFFIGFKYIIYIANVLMYSRVVTLYFTDVYFIVMTIISINYYSLLVAVQYLICSQLYYWFSMFSVESLMACWSHFCLKYGRCSERAIAYLAESLINYQNLNVYIILQTFSRNKFLTNPERSVPASPWEMILKK